MTKARNIAELANDISVDNNRDVTLSNLRSDQPMTFRNRIINGNLSNPINQRGAGSITESTGYNYDRWYYDGTTYLYQGVEDKNVNNGTYVISWEGSGINAAWKVSTDTTANNGPDATTGFTSVSNGGTFTVNEGTEYSKHLWIRFDGTLANLDKVMVEEGTVPTPFEHRPIGTELALCQRYYFDQTLSGSYSTPLIRERSNVNGYYGFVEFPVEMRVIPTFGFYSGDTTLSIHKPSVRFDTATYSIISSTTNNILLLFSPSVDDTNVYVCFLRNTNGNYYLDAEL